MNSKHNAEKTYYTKAVAIYAVGPEPTRNYDGDEIPVWFVYAGDDEGESVGKTYEVYNYERALSLANNMSRDRKLPLENDMSRA